MVVNCPFPSSRRVTLTSVDPHELGGSRRHSASDVTQHSPSIDRLNMDETTTNVTATTPAGFDSTTRSNSMPLSNTNVIIIWVIATSSAIVTLGICCACNYLHQKNSARRFASRRTGILGPAATGTVSDKELEANAPIKISNPLSCRDSCAICREAYAGGRDEILIGYMRVCGHYFHYECVWRWINSRSTCPLCRERVTDDVKEDAVKGMTLTELEKLFGVPEGSLKRARRDSFNHTVTAEDSGQIKTISITMTLPNIIPD